MEYDGSRRCVQQLENWQDVTSFRFLTNKQCTFLGTRKNKLNQGLILILWARVSGGFCEEKNGATSHLFWLKVYEKIKEECVI